MSATKKHPPVLSVVDYDAWQRGYMPPTEHILIDELSYRGAKVIASASGPKTGYWLVWKGPRPDRKALKAVVMSLMELEAALEDGPEQQPEPEQAPEPLPAPLTAWRADNG